MTNERPVVTNERPVVTNERALALTNDTAVQYEHPLEKLQPTLSKILADVSQKSCSPHLEYNFTNVS